MVKRKKNKFKTIENKKISISYYIPYKIYQFKGFIN